MAHNDGQLFKLDKFGYPKPYAKPGVNDSADRRRTIRNNETIAKGRHPATGRKLLHVEWGFSCKNCAHHYSYKPGKKTYHKCALVPHTGGPRTDIRVGWPACTAYRIDST